MATLTKLDTSGMYDLFFRNYDPALGRMHGVDPMAGKYSGLSPYNYSFNDPVYWNDPLGDDVGGNEAFDKKFGSGGGYEDPHAGGDMYGKSFDFTMHDAANGRADAAFNNLNTGFSGAWNLAAYGSYSGAGGKTSIGGFGAGYHGTWSSQTIKIGETRFWVSNLNAKGDDVGFWMTNPIYSKIYTFQETQGGSGADTPPILFIEFLKTPKGVDRNELLSEVKQGLISNGVRPDVVVAKYSVWESFKAWISSRTSAYITIRNFAMGDKITPSGGQAERNSNEGIVYNGLTQMGSRNIILPRWFYPNVILHELGHAVWGFEDVDHGGCTTCIMDYDGTYNQGASFTSEQIQTIKSSKWGKN